MAISLNSLNTGFLLCYLDEGKRQTRADSKTPGGLSIKGIIVAAEEKERREDCRTRELPPSSSERRFFSAAGRSRSRQSYRAIRAGHRRPPASDQPRQTPRGRTQA